MSEKKYPTIYSIDFDGTIVEKGKFPEFGKPVEKVVEYIREIQRRGDDWILNTNREGEDLKMAVKWLEYNGLHPSIVNDNLPRMKEFFGHNPRKIFANVVIDDLNAGGVYLPPMDGTMDFGQAIRELKNGKRVQRASWKNFKAYLYLMTAEDGRKLFALHTMDKMPEREWNPSCQDCFAEDWVVVE